MAFAPASSDVELGLLSPDALINASQAAAYLASTESRLANMRKDGIGPAFVKGDGAEEAIRYRKQDLDAWLAAVKTGGQIR